VLERTTHPYYGTIWDREGKEMSFKDQYRVDFLTDRAVRFLEQPQEKPFFLYISQPEPHFQNDLNTVVGPKGMTDKYQNPIVPSDLSSLPDVWQQQLPDYYAAIERIDQSVGRIVETLGKQNLLDNTIFLFTSDHGCHFGTRENNYKRTPPRQLDPHTHAPSRTRPARESPHRLDCREHQYHAYPPRPLRATGSRVDERQEHGFAYQFSRWRGGMEKPRINSVQPDQ